jgi:hypothetical protein
MASILLSISKAKKMNIFDMMSLIKISALLLLAYFISGTMLLPEGDFSTLPDIPKMYAHCKTEEDPDMDLPDFITEHLLEIDGVFGQVQDEPDEKPHQPVQLHHQLSQIIFVAHQFNIMPVVPQSIPAAAIAVSDEIYLSDYHGALFRPPIA